MTNLETIVLDSNQISNITSSCFDGLYNLKEVHDSYIWDDARKEFENRGTQNFDIGDGRVGHVQARSILGPVYDHIKGPKRKKLMRSPEARVK